LSQKPNNRKSRRAQKRAHQECAQRDKLLVVPGETEQKRDTSNPDDLESGDKQEDKVGLAEIVKRSSITDWCLTVFTLALVVTSFFQWDVAKVQQRPWVGPEIGSSPIKVGEVGQPYTWLVNFRNFGSSPALHVRWDTRVWAANYEPVWADIESEIEKLPLNERGMEFTIFNGQTLPNFGNGTTILAQDKALLSSGKEHFILGGRLEYKDQFDNIVHETTFCIIYNPPTPVYPGEGWTSCPVKPLAT
jgi:hypothetical protein